MRAYLYVFSILFFLITNSTSLFAAEAIKQLAVNNDPISVVENRSSYATVPPLILAYSSENEPLIFANSFGQPKGLLVDIWNEWASTTEQKIEFKKITESDPTKLLFTGEADVYIGISPIVENISSLKLSQKMYETYSGVYHLAGTDQPIIIGNYGNQEIGIVADSYQDQMFKKVFPHVAVKEYANNTDLLDALLNGEVRAIAQEELVMHAVLDNSGLREKISERAERLFQHPVYANVLAGNEELLQLINTGFEEIDPKKLVEIENAWVPYSSIRYYVSPEETGLIASEDLSISKTEKGFLKDHQTLSLACVDSGPYCFEGENQEINGLVIDYLKIIEEETSIKIPIKLYPSIDSALAGIRNGEVDGLAITTKQKSREDFLTFTESYFTTQASIYIDREAPFKVQSLQDLSGKKIAFNPESLIYRNLLSQIDGVTPVPSESNEQDVNFVRSGKADVFLSAFTGANYYLNKNEIADIVNGYNIPFGHVNVVCSIKNELATFIPFLNKGIQAITPEQHIEIRSKWSGVPDSASVSDRDGKLDLTQEEQEWLAQNNVIRMGVDDSYAPYSFRDAKGKYQGIAVEYIDYIANVLGVQIDIVPDLEWAQIVAGVKNKKVDVALTMVQTPERNEFVDFTDIYLPTPLVVMKRNGDRYINGEDDLDTKRVALVESYSTSQKIMKEHPFVVPILVKTPEEALQAVSTGRADGYVGVLGITQYLIQQNDITNLELVGLYGKGDNGQRLGVRKDWPQLAKILDKVLASMTDSQKANMTRRWLPYLNNVQQALTPGSMAVELTPAEEEYLRNHKEPFKVSSEQDFTPFNFSKAGQPLGYSIDYMNLVAEKLKIDVEYVNGPGWSQFLEQMTQGSLDIMLNIVQTEQRDKYLSFTKRYLQSHTGIFGIKDRSDIKDLADLVGKTIAVPSGYYVHDLLRKLYPGVSLLLVETPLQALTAVSQGQADATLGNKVVLMQLMKDFLISNIQLVGMVRDKRFSRAMRLAVSKEDLILKGIIEKGMAAITPREVTVLTEKWLGVNQSISSLRQNLLPKEQDWLALHPQITVGVDYSAPPYTFVNSSGVADGLMADFFKLLSNKFGVDFKLVPNTSLESAIERVNAKQLDAISVMSLPGNNIDDFLIQTESILRVPIATATRRDTTPIRTVSEFANKKVVIVKGVDFDLASLAENLPSSVQEVETHLEGLELIAANKADVLVGFLGTINYWLQKYYTDSLFISPLPSIYKNSLTTLVRFDLPELASIINAGLDSLTKDERLMLQRKWTPVLDQQSPLLNIKKERPSYLVFGLLIALFVAIVGICFLPRFLKDELIIRNFGTKNLRYIVICAISLMIILVMYLVWATLQENKKIALDSISDDLEIVLRNTNERNDFWIEDHLRLLNQFGQNQEIVKMTKDLLKVPVDKITLSRSAAQEEVRQFVAEREDDFDNIGFFIINPDNISIGSRRNSNLGSKNLIAIHAPELLKYVFQGTPMFIPPIPSDVHLEDDELGLGRTDEKPYTMFFAVPIKDINGDVLAVLAQRLLPTGHMSKIMQGGRIGRSGESYVVNASGQMVTESRFVEELVEIGLVDPNAKNPQPIMLRTPGVNLFEDKNGKVTGEKAERPFTKMAANLLEIADSAKSGHSLESHSAIVVDIEGYTDYRGVEVFGAWMWDSHLNLGMATEIDASEGLAGYHKMRLTLFSIVGLTLLLVVIAALLTVILGEKAASVMRRSTQELEVLVEERTSEAKSAQAYFQHLLEATPDGLLVVNKEGTILFANTVLGHIFGYSKEEVVGEKVEILLPPEIRERHVGVRTGYYEKPKAREMGANLKLEGQHRDGSRVPIEISLSPITTDDEGVLTIAAIRDITDRKAAENELRKLSSAIEQSPACIIITDKNGIIEFVNPVFSETTGYAAEEVIGKNPNILNSGVHPKSYFVEMWKALKSGETWDGDIVNQTKDGEHIWVSGPISPLLDENGEIQHFLAVQADISEKKQIQFELQKREERFSSLVRNIPGAVYRCANDEHWTMTFISEAIELITGYESDDYVNNAVRSYDSVIHSDDRKYVTEEVNRTFAEDGTFHVEYRIIHKDGSIRWVFERGQLVEVEGEDESNKAANIDGIIFDITVRKEMEDALVIAKEEAEAATKSKSDFLANMSHEIRTPMNAVIGMSHLALQTNLNRKQQNYIEKVKRSAESLLGIINDILDFSKIEAGKLDIENIGFRLDDVLDNFSNVVGLKAEEKGLELLFDLPAGLHKSLIGDPLRLGQILLNLGNNAVKFTDSGEIVIGVEVINATDTELEYKFTIKDSGIGMSKEQQAKLFKSFSQVDASTTRKYGGTGLGLAISKNLTHLMGGKIWVESEPGEGSSFIFTIIFGKQEDQGEDEGFEVENLGVKRILVVDDNAIAREILCSIIESFGMEVDQAVNGEEALAKLEESSKNDPYQIVIMDWQMQGLNGIETTKSIQDSDIANVPTVIMVTAYDREEAANAAKDVKISSFLSKPVTSSTLLDAISHAVGRSLTKGSHRQNKEEETNISIQRLQGARILLVEDNDMNQELAVDLLTSNGMHVEVANHGQEALAKLEEFVFDGILMDCQMPVMDGYEATLAIRKQDKYKELPILAMTANAMAGDRDKVMKVGMNDHISKPIDVDDMFRVMAEWIKPAIPNTVAKRQDKVEVKIPDFKGINVKDGLARTLGDTALYMRLLKKFTKSQANFVDELNSSLEEKDWNTCTRLAHTLKGVAGNIGAKQLQEAAGVLEAELGNENEDEAIMFNVEIELNKILAELTVLEEPEETVVGQDNLVDTASLVLILETLIEQLEEYDTNAQELIDANRQLFSSSQLAEKLKKIERYLGDYDFDNSLTCVKEILTSFQEEAEPASSGDDLEKLISLSTELATAFNNYDTEALDIIEEEENLFIRLDLSREFKDITRALDKYDFTAAHTALETVASRYEFELAGED